MRAPIFTAPALQGVNFEAATKLTGLISHPAFSAARAHLQHCRQAAELFDPEMMDDYRRIQGQREVDESQKIKTTVIHAEADFVPRKLSFIVECRLGVVDFDSQFPNDTTVHIYLHPIGSLAVGRGARGCGVQFSE